MKILDNIRLLNNDHPLLITRLNYAESFFKNKDLINAAKQFKELGRELLKLRLYTFAIEIYKKVSFCYEQSANYYGLVATEITIFETYKILQNLTKMADTYEKLASHHRYLLKDPLTAANFYFWSAKYHEENQNYFAASAKASFACECLAERQSSRKAKTDAYALTFRLFLKAGRHEKAGVYAQKWLSVIKKDYSAHYISVCVRGYKAFDRTDRRRDALAFRDEIILAHFEHSKTQTNIRTMLAEAQQISLLIDHKINEAYFNYAISILNTKEMIRYVLDLRNLAQQQGIADIADECYLREQDMRKERAYEQNQWARFISYFLWSLICRYGTSFRRWMICTCAIIFLFGCSFAPWHWAVDNHWLQELVRTVKPSIRNNGGADSWFSPWYYSVVTIATLGYGDVVPADTSGQIFSVAEVLIGYLLFGGLISVFSKKITR